MGTHDPRWGAQNVPSNEASLRKLLTRRRCDPDAYVRCTAQDRNAITECLMKASQQERPPLNTKFIRLVNLWRFIASDKASGSSPRNDLTVLRWLLKGRAREAIVFLRQQADLGVWQALKAIERIANFGFPSANVMAKQMAYGGWGLLQRELTGEVGNTPPIDIRKIKHVQPGKYVNDR